MNEMSSFSIGTFLFIYFLLSVMDLLFFIFSPRPDRVIVHRMQEGGCWPGDLPPGAMAARVSPFSYF